MEIPRGQGNGDGEIFNTMGNCATCGMNKMSIGGRLQCPNCDTTTITGSGLVNNIKSVPQSAFKKVTKKALDGTTYEEFVPKTKMEMQKEIGVQKTVIGVGIEPSTIRPVEDGSKKYTSQRDETIGTLSNPIVALGELERYFLEAPAKSLTEFKKVDKLRKSLKKLRTQTEEYLGGK